MSQVVLDSSAILALLGRERGADVVEELLGRIVVSAVNLAEIQGKLVGRGIEKSAASKAIVGIVSDVIDFDEECALLTGSLVADTQTLGLSLGDRACLALGILLKSPVYTADRAWTKLKLGIDVRAIR
jgi:PIN domain nuclease of toxin-antitoxin system